MKLQPLNPKKIAEMTAIAQTEEMLKTLSIDQLDAIWRKDCQDKAQAFLDVSGYRGYYRYHDSHAIKVTANWSNRDGFEDTQLAVTFWAAYSGNDMNLILDCLADNHWACFWVESDGSLTWARDRYAE